MIPIAWLAPRSSKSPADDCNGSARCDRVRRDLGDFQTPRELVSAVLRALGSIGSRWSRVLEPTCGTGTFLEGVLEHACPPRELIGIELQESHVRRARSIQASRRVEGPRVEILHADLFDLNLATDIPWRT